MLFNSLPTCQIEKHFYKFSTEIFKKASACFFITSNSSFFFWILSSSVIFEMKNSKERKKKRKNFQKFLINFDMKQIPLKNRETTQSLSFFQIYIFPKNYKKINKKNIWTRPILINKPNYILYYSFLYNIINRTFPIFPTFLRIDQKNNENQKKETKIRRRIQKEEELKTKHFHTKHKTKCLFFS